ncbi:PorP/SprF family type IX secretion system membrane protein [Gaoshiqia sediminis]|uniref:PorP/SprF family type IX secretion system membrane protein n=1 Tax=Gaoshiqia sediminis TaxID=2986998 RepID=A0AA41Y9X8_9BACT|nr:PorP/SprF family type IX secretion system membrane protein [Gaoshiqia sediminis]MCW0481960.1 PorP/SprF family type IX secretion system membrane protein [Gaoshiqia sediminis]
MKNRFFVLLLLLVCKMVTGQDAEYSQFFANPIYLNPGFAGTADRARIAVNYRNQWPQQGSTFVNYSLSFDQFMTKLNGGLGFQVHNNRELNGIVENTTINAFYSHHLKINERFFMDMGMKAGLAYKKLDYRQLIFPDMINQLTGERYLGAGDQPENSTLLYPDFGIGILGQYDSFFGGISLDHLTQPHESVFVGDQQGRLPLKLTIHAGARSHQLHRGLLSREFTVSPNVIYQQQGAFKQLNLGIYLLEKSLAGGVWYRQNSGFQPDALIFMAGVMRENFKLGYSYDTTLSRLSNFTNGAHEISLIFFVGEKHADRDALLIPSL